VNAIILTGKGPRRWPFDLMPRVGDVVTLENGSRKFPPTYRRVTEVIWSVPDNRAVIFTDKYVAPSAAETLESFSKSQDFQDMRQG
jgi:hypothetical protein